MMVMMLMVMTRARVGLALLMLVVIVAAATVVMATAIGNDLRSSMAASVGPTPVLPGPAVLIAGYGDHSSGCL